MEENMETTVSGNESSAGAAYAGSPAEESLDEQQYIQFESSPYGGAGGDQGMDLMENLAQLVESISSAQIYGSIGDYYHEELGFYVFPDFDTWQYFIDIDAVGEEWAQASNGHYVKVLDLEAYEAYTAGEDSAAADTEVSSETDLQNMELLESINGTLAVIKQNQALYYENVYEYQTQVLANQEELLAWEEIQTYSEIGCGVLLGMIAGCLLAESFFGKMRLG